MPSPGERDDSATSRVSPSRRAQADEAIAWRRELHDREASGSRRLRAELRRAHSLSEIACTEAFASLVARLRGRGVLRPDLERWALIAGVLAWGHRSTPSHDDGEGTVRVEAFAELLGRGEHGRPYLDSSRFKRLLRMQDKDELLLWLTRLVNRMGERCPDKSLVLSLLGWDDTYPSGPRRGLRQEHVQKSWALAYFGASSKSQ